MLKKIIKTHTARLDYVDSYQAYFFTKSLRQETAKDGWSLVKENRALNENKKIYVALKVLVRNQEASLGHRLLCKRNV